MVRSSLYIPTSILLRSRQLSDFFQRTQLLLKLSSNTRTCRSKRKEQLGILSECLVLLSFLRHILIDSSRCSQY
ncbi:unnamed protein product [Chondrus crispus]|uniref:Uncharacterized protein n=1 Tax=Chondrus crispus TaxID=2769 RepID=R7Q5B1_CHOCR|nr:unnamed protein product [Chondrus crispus]CDF32546.1 unnamed protein product [Chondrus crispus]|eukprot:XP_005712211.1 unnamed protein product [Chondrus crispus]